MDEIFYNQSHWVWSKVERPLKTVIGDWKHHAALMLTDEGVYNENGNEVSVNYIDQWGIEAIML